MKSTSRKIRGVLLALAAAAVLLLPVCAAAGPPTVWKVGTLAPKGVGWARQVEELVLPMVAQTTEGTVSLKIYWGGIMGDDRQIIEKMRTGVLQSAGLTALGATLIAPEFGVVELPFLFQGYDEVDYLREKMFPVFAGLMERKGFVLYLWVDQDFDQIYSVKKPIATAADFDGVRFVTWHKALEGRVLGLLNAVAVPETIPEIRGTIRSGQADALVAPAIWMVGIQLYSTVRFVTEVPIRYSPAVIVVKRETWEAVPAKYRERALTARPGVTEKFVAATRRDNEKSIEAMMRYGVRRVSVDPGSVREMAFRTRPVYKEMVGLLYDRELLEQVLAQIEAYRRTKE